jgi:hypothetical protein
MSEAAEEIRWAPRVAQEKIRRLYETDARGVYDAELIDDVGWALLARCEALLAAEEARAGRAKCHRCGAIIHHAGGQEEVLHCACGWQVAWRSYFRSIQHKQLSGPDLVGLFRDFVTRFPPAETPRARMLLIDALIHGFHWSVQTGPRRPSAINLIEGRLNEVIRFLDALTYGEASTAGTQDTHAAWRRDMKATLISWGSPGLDQGVAHEGEE